MCSASVRQALALRRVLQMGSGGQAGMYVKHTGQAAQRIGEAGIGTVQSLAHGSVWEAGLYVKHTGRAAQRIGERSATDAGGVRQRQGVHVKWCAVRGCLSDGPAVNHAMACHSARRGSKSSAHVCACNALTMGVSFL